MPANIDPAAIRVRAEQELRRQESIIDMNAFLDGLLARFNARDTELTNRRLEEIVSALNAAGIESDRLLFGGSVARHTFVDGLSDIDALVIMKERPGSSPKDLIDDFGTALRKHLPASMVEGVRVGTLAATVSFPDGTEIQLLPAIARGADALIASPDGSEWRAIRPRRFAKQLTSVNQANGGRVVPTVKLAKALLQLNLPERDQLSGYHVEAIAVRAFSAYAGPTRRDAMLQHLVSTAEEAVRRPLSDVTGQSPSVDQYLGPAGSPERERIAASLRRVNVQLKSASSEAALRELFGE
ncbi:MAG: nucleotidyltransferase [Bifidobacteriaceae bacterium]|nr:nucleotidyltransferase [Bifidobacteriaceae bacterium]